MREKKIKRERERGSERDNFGCIEVIHFQER
jgi:hypothetical protein